MAELQAAEVKTTRAREREELREKAARGDLGILDLELAIDEARARGLRASISWNYLEAADEFELASDLCRLRGEL